jgi:PleD family two-component response regulator
MTSLVTRADAALIAGKRQGRNRTVRASTMKTEESAAA